LYHNGCAWDDTIIRNTAMTNKRHKILKWLDQKI